MTFTHMGKRKTVVKRCGRCGGTKRVSMHPGQTVDHCAKCYRQITAPSYCAEFDGPCPKDTRCCNRETRIKFRLKQGLTEWEM